MFLGGWNLDKLAPGHRLFHVGKTKIANFPTPHGRVSGAVKTYQNVLRFEVQMRACQLPAVSRSHFVVEEVESLRQIMNLHENIVRCETSGLFWVISEDFLR